MHGLNDLVNGWIATVLARYLKVDKENINFSTHTGTSNVDVHEDENDRIRNETRASRSRSSDPTKTSSIVLRDMELRPLKIPLKKHRIHASGIGTGGDSPRKKSRREQQQKSFTTFLNLSGRIERLEISLQWSSFMNLNHTTIDLRGLHLVADLTIEVSDIVAADKERNGIMTNCEMPDDVHHDDTGDVDVNYSNGHAYDSQIPYDPDVDLETTTSTTTTAPISSLVWEFFKQEQDRIMMSVRDIIPSSDIIRRLVFHFVNTLRLKLSDVEIQLLSSRDDLETLLPKNGPTIDLVVTLERFFFIPQIPFSKESQNFFYDQSTDFTRIIHVEFDNFSVDLVGYNHDGEDEGYDEQDMKNTRTPQSQRQRRHSEHEKAKMSHVVPVLEPISFSGTVRRTYGMVFVDLMYGFDIVGRLGSSSSSLVSALRKDEPYLSNGSSDKSNGVKHSEASDDGVVLHLGPSRRAVLLAAYNRLVGGRSSTNKKNDKDHDNDMFEEEKKREEAMRRKRLTTRTLAHILLSMLGLLVFYLSRYILIDVYMLADSFQKFIKAEPTSLLSILYHLSLAGACASLVVYSQIISRFLRSHASVYFRRGMDLDSARKHPALLNLRLNRLTVYLSDGDSVSLTGLSVSGRLNATVLNVWSSGLSIVPGTIQNPSETPFANGKNIRVVKNDSGWSIGLGIIERLIVPGKLSITEPLVDTVITYWGGKLGIRLERLVGTRINRIKDEAADRHSERNGSFNVDSKQETPIDKDKIRRQINDDISTQRHKFHTIALMFEGIPLKTNKLNLWRLNDTFRGTDGVEYMLELNIAQSRDEAVLIGNKLMDDFDLFQDVRGDVYSFRDDPGCIYRFTRPDRRRNWERKFRPIRGTTGSAGDDDGSFSQLIPFMFTFRAKELLLVDDQGNKMISMRMVYGIAKPSSYIRALEIVASVKAIETELLFVARSRLQGYYHPDLPSEIHDGQFNVEYMKAAGGFTTESWYKTLGFRGDEEKAAIERNVIRVVDSTKATTHRMVMKTRDAVDATESEALKFVDRLTQDDLATTSSSMQKAVVNLKIKARWQGHISKPDGTDEDMLHRPGLFFVRKTSDISSSSVTFATVGDGDTPKGVIRLPHFYIAPFSLRLKLKGLLASSKENRIRVEKYEGDGSTTSNDLIVHFVTVVLGRSPGMIGTMNIMGVNVAEGGGMAAVWMTTAMIPGGQYLAMAAIAAMDGVSGVVAAGKRSRGKPDGNYRPGDFCNGLVYGAKELNQTGAMRRGKEDTDYYDSDGRVKFDIGDFAAGATYGTCEYIEERKGKFVGAAVAAATVITLTVVAGPLVGMGVALIVGAGTEIAVNKIDRSVREKEDQDEEKDDDLM